MSIEPTARPGRSSRPKTLSGLPPFPRFSFSSIGLRAETTAPPARRQSLSAERQLDVGAEGRLLGEPRAPLAHGRQRRAIDARDLEPTMRGRSDGDVAHRECLAGDVWQP